MQRRFYIVIDYHNLFYVSGDKKVTAAIAFSLALFSHVLNHVVIRLQSALYEIENPRKHLDADNMGKKDSRVDSTCIFTRSICTVMFKYKYYSHQATSVNYFN